LKEKKARTDRGYSRETKSRNRNEWSLGQEGIGKQIMKPKEVFVIHLKGREIGTKRD